MSNEIPPHINLDMTVAATILPLLKEHRDKYLSSIPGRILIDEDFNNVNEDVAVKKWEEIIDKIIHSLEVIDSDNPMSYDDKVQEGCELLGEYLTCLWL